MLTNALLKISSSSPYKVGERRAKSALVTHNMNCVTNIERDLSRYANRARV